MAALTVSYLPSIAQGSVPVLTEPNYNKPKLFSDLPEKMTLRLADMEALLSLPVGTAVKATIATGFSLVGTVVSKSNPSDPSVKSTVINCSNRQGATLTFTRVTQDDGTYAYIGRMMSKDASDVLEIAKEGTGYIIRKKGFYDLINE